MLTKGIADRYARALMELAGSRRELDQYDDELDSIREMHKLDPSLLQFLSHPKVEAEKKKKLVEDVFASRVSPYVLSMILLLIDKKRGHLLMEVAGRYSLLADEVRGVEKGTVTTAVPLPDDLYEKLREEIQRHSLHEIVLDKRVDPSIIGGAVIQLGNHVFNGSVRYRLRRFREEMSKVAVSGE